MKKAEAKKKLRRNRKIGEMNDDTHKLGGKVWKP